MSDIDIASMPVSLTNKRKGAKALKKSAKKRGSREIRVSRCLLSITCNNEN